MARVPDDAVHAILELIRSGSATTRQDIARHSGLSRSAIAERLDRLLELGLVGPTDEPVASGGRPATRFGFNPTVGVILAADLGVTHSRVAITDLGAQLLGEESIELGIEKGPKIVLGAIEEALRRLLARGGYAAGEVWGVGVGLPGPVDFLRGMTINPPIMPGWDSYPVAEHLAERFQAPVLVDNDVNAMATGEHRSCWGEVDNMLFVKVGTGIGSGIIASGQIHRGEDGAAGDIGHVHISGHDAVMCRCGNTGCLEAVAGGGAIAAQLRERGFSTPDTRSVVDLATGGNVEAIQLIRKSGRLLGEALAAAVNFFNPRLIIIGGDLAAAEQQLFAGLREVIYQRSLPLATRHLRIASSGLGDRAGLVGCAVMVANHALASIDGRPRAAIAAAQTA